LSNATAIMAFSNFLFITVFFFLFFIKVLRNKFLCYIFPIIHFVDRFSAKLIRDEWYKYSAKLERAFEIGRKVELRETFMRLSGLFWSKIPLTSYFFSPGFSFLCLKQPKMCAGGNELH